MTFYKTNSAPATPLEKLTAAVRRLGRELRAELEKAGADNPVAIAIELLP